MNQGYMIESSGISFSYNNGEEASLHDVSLSVKPGECVVLCGKSGSGKTTFLRLLNGLCPFFFNGELTGSCISAGLTAGEAAIEEYVPHVGSVFQNPKTQYFNTNTTAELAFALENTGVPSEEIRRRVDKCAEEFGLETLLDRNIFKLSGGEKQKIAFAAATVLKPGLLVLDEPTSNLDEASIEKLGEMIAIMKKKGVTVVLAEHRLAWLTGIADRYFFFEDGYLKECFRAKEFGELSEESLYERGLRTANLAPHRKRILEKTHTDSPFSPLLTAKNLLVGYQKEKPVCEIPALSLYPGEIVGLMGHNGIGKSTLAKTLCGLLKPLSGEILWSGKKASKKELIGHSFLVMQDVNYQLFADSVREEVLLSAARSEKCDEVLKTLGLDGLCERHPMSLSGGQKQRVAVASAMLSGKELILLDEPTSGLDHYHMTQVGQLLCELKAQGKCVLVITHDEELTAKWCDRVIVLTDNESKGEDGKWK